MGKKNNAIFTEDEISELENFLKNKEWGNIVDFAIEKVEKDNLKIIKVHNTRNFININDSDMNSYSYKIKMSGKKRKTEAYALTAYTMGLLGGAKTNFVDIRDKRGKSISTKHPKNHSRKDIIEGLDCINKCIEEYKLCKEAGLPYVSDTCEEICSEIVVKEKNNKEFIPYQSITKEEKEEIESYVKEVFINEPETSVTDIVEYLKVERNIEISRTPLDKWKGETNKILEEKRKRDKELWKDSDNLKIPRDSQEYSIFFGDKKVSDYNEEIPKGSYVLEEILEKTEIKDGDIITTKRLKMNYLE